MSIIAPADRGRIPGVKSEKTRKRGRIKEQGQQTSHWPEPILPHITGRVTGFVSQFQLSVILASLQTCTSEEGFPLFKIEMVEYHHHHHPTLFFSVFVLLLLFFEAIVCKIEKGFSRQSYPDDSVSALINLWAHMG